MRGFDEARTDECAFVVVMFDLPMKCSDKRAPRCIMALHKFIFPSISQCMLYNNISSSVSTGLNR